MTQNNFDIFISYRHDDGAQYAKTLQLELEKRGYKVFLDYEKLADGVLDDTIKQAIASAPTFIMLLTPGYLAHSMDEDSWIRDEIELATQTEKNFIPLEPNHQFDDVPDGTPAEVADIVDSYAHASVDFGSSLSSSIDTLVKKHIVKRRKRLHRSVSGRGLWQVGVVIAAVTIGLICLATVGQRHKGKRGEKVTYSKTYDDNLVKAAEANDALAQYYLGIVLEKGIGTAANTEDAVEWYRKASIRNLDSAQVNLGRCYLEGIGIGQDTALAVEWFTEAANHGNSDAMFSLGMFHLNAGHVKEATEWLQDAVEHGNTEAADALAKMKE